MAFIICVNSCFSIPVAVVYSMCGVCKSVNPFLTPVVTCYATEDTHFRLFNPLFTN
jgi:hypothetical protein